MRAESTSKLGQMKAEVESLRRECDASAAEISRLRLLEQQRLPSISRSAMSLEDEFESIRRQATMRSSPSRFALPSFTSPSKMPIPSSNHHLVSTPPTLRTQASPDVGPRSISTGSPGIAAGEVFAPPPQRKTLPPAAKGAASTNTQPQAAPVARQAFATNSLS